MRPTVSTSDPRPRRALVALHGWSDYFHNVPLARAAERSGYAFHALDLRHYGRSLREGQTPGWTDDLRRYDADLEAALAVILAEHPEPPVLLAHSTGGLVGALWADRHPGRLGALVLNSPWLEMHGSAAVRQMARAVTRPVAAANPYALLTLPRVDHYWRSLSAAADGEWDLHPLWRPRWAFDVPAAWLAAVADVVLDPAAMGQRALLLGDHVTVQRHPGAVHDVFASAAPIREAAWASTQRWLGAYAPPVPASTASTAPPYRRSRRA